MKRRSDRDLFARRNEKDARAALVDRYDRLARRIARRFRGRGVSRDDLVQVARYGLLKAIDRFDVDRGTTFGTFARSTIEGEIKHHFRDKAWTMRVPRSLQNLRLRAGDAAERLQQELGRPPTVRELASRLDESEERVARALAAGTAFDPTSLDRPGDGASETEPLIRRLGSSDGRLEMTPERVDVSEAVESLSKRDKRILRLRFDKGETQQEIADQVGVSQVQVSRLLSRIINRLRGAVRPNGDDEAPNG